MHYLIADQIRNLVFSDEIVAYSGWAVLNSVEEVYSHPPLQIEPGNHVLMLLKNLREDG